MTFYIFEKKHLSRVKSFTVLRQWQRRVQFGRQWSSVSGALNLRVIPLLSIAARTMSRVRRSRRKNACLHDLKGRSQYSAFFVR